MPITSLTYHPTLVRSSARAERDYALLEQAIASFEAGEARRAFDETLRHFSADLATGPEANGPWTFTQGSSQVRVELDGDRLRLQVPLVKLPEGGRAVAAMRHLLSKIAGSGQLHQPRLRGDQVTLEFEDRLEHMHPIKILEVLRRMPTEADQNDDWLMGQFGATALERAPMDPLTADEQAAAITMWRSHWQEIDDLLDEAQRKRSIWFLNEVTALARFRITFCLPFGGMLEAKLREAASTFNDTDNEPMKREAALGKFITEMKAVTDADLLASLGHARYAVPPRSDGQLKTILGYFAGNYLESVEKFHNDGNTIVAAVSMICSYTFLQAVYIWPPEIAEPLREGLAASSGKPWREASASMIAHAKGLAKLAREMSDDDDEDEDEEEGDDAGDDETEAQGAAQ